jgi:mitochondrial fission protein ELM1
MERSPHDDAGGTWALSDGRAGNARQAMALAAALDAAAEARVLASRPP